MGEGAAARRSCWFYSLLCSIPTCGGNGPAYPSESSARSSARSRSLSMMTSLRATCSRANTADMLRSCILGVGGGYRVANTSTGPRDSSRLQMVHSSFHRLETGNAPSAETGAPAQRLEWLAPGGIEIITQHPEQFSE